MGVRGHYSSDESVQIQKEIIFPCFRSDDFSFIETFEYIPVRGLIIRKFLEIIFVCWILRLKLFLLLNWQLQVQYLVGFFDLLFVV